MILTAATYEADESYFINLLTKKLAAAAYTVTAFSKFIQ